MSNLIWTPPASLGWSVFKSPRMSTIVQEATSGKTVRAALWADPLWDFKFRWEVLRDSGSSPTALRQLMDWFVSRQGSYDTFLYQDPYDYSITGQLLGYGDGSTLSFQLARPLAPNGLTETIQNPNVVSAVKVDGSPLSAFAYSIGTENLLLQSQSFNNAPWIHNLVTVTDNSQTAPDGTTTASTLAFSATGPTDYGSVRQVIALVPKWGEKVTVSIWLKAAAPMTGPIYFEVGNSPNFEVVDLQPSITTSWQRFEVTKTYTGVSSGAAYFVIAMPPSQSAHTVYAWGAQLERWPTASGYIPTAGVAIQPRGLVTLASAPTSGQMVTADFTYYFRLRFKNDIQEFENFVRQLWAAQTVEMTSEKV